MSTIKNKRRSQIHKKYNKEKELYKHWEHKIKEYKEGLYGTDKSFILEFRKKLNLVVVNLKAYKHEMSARNKEYNQEHP